MAGADAGQRSRLLTVVKVRPRDGYAEVMFAESARIYRLLRSNPHHDETLHVLVGSVGRRVWVRFDRPNGDVIEAVTRDSAP